jgi:hypothetical protein
MMLKDEILVYYVFLQYIYSNEKHKMPWIVQNWQQSDVLTNHKLSCHQSCLCKENMKNLTSGFLGIPFIEKTELIMAAQVKAWIAGTFSF